MTELQQHTESEISKVYPNLRFEPGDHGQNTNPYEIPAESPQYKAFHRGDPYAHDWNSGLIRRIEATQPKIVAIDGLDFAEQAQPGVPKLIPPFSDNIWIHLPTTPERMNPTEKSILVVCGDNSEVGAAFNAGELTHPDLQALSKALSRKTSDDLLAAERDDHTEALAILGGMALIDAALVSRIGYRKAVEKKKVISRRNFLKLGIAAGVTAAAAGNYFLKPDTGAAVAAGEADTEVAKDQWMEAVDLLDPKVFKDKQTNMRTAMLILKTKDAIDQLGLPQDVASSIIMGTAHTSDAQHFLASDRTAQAAIRDYVETLDPLLTQTLRAHPSISREEALRGISEVLTKTFVMKVDEPDHRSFGTPKLPSAVDKAISTVSEFSSPRVAAAVAGWN
jgi:hypothetical protein